MNTPEQCAHNHTQEKVVSAMTEYWEAPACVSNRLTTRQEHKASRISLFSGGLFNVNLPTVYGEDAKPSPGCKKP